MKRLQRKTAVDLLRGFSDQNLDRPNYRWVVSSIISDSPLDNKEGLAKPHQAITPPERIPHRWQVLTFASSTG